ncbi:hypothetical protein B0H21DRAFT_727845 [Amylocystis lapponica]|nr:hypothetical protein B0H21DRAFT_727845 [Amylocystis lapponica]
MSTDVASATSGTLRQRPNTRSSIRHSLNLSSVSRASQTESAAEREKAPKKPKDVSSRRSSSIAQAPPRASMDRALAKKREDEASPDAKNSDERSSSPLAPSPKPTLPRVSTLRPRTANASSALPKYRPRSGLGEPDAPKKPPSPVRVGTRRRLSSSDDQKEDTKKSTLEPSPTAEKGGRPISPLPHRAALKVNLTSAINVKPARPVTPEKKSKVVPKDSPPSRHGSSARPTKTTKTSTNASAVRSAIPRPPSSSSTSSSSRTPHTPKTPASAVKVTPGSQRGSQESNPLRRAAPPPPESPLSRLSARKVAKPVRLLYTRISQQGSTTTTPTSSAHLFTEGSSTDSIEAHDVEFMLSSVVSPTAPTPALPRFRTTGHSAAQYPHTPTRPSLFLPTRNHLSYLSPDPHSQNSPHLRPKPHNAGNDRGSILSWEQLAKHTKTLDDEDVERMLSERHALPTAYGSISQVLLPDVTPSPAVHNLPQRFDHASSDAAAGSATIERAHDAFAEIEALQRQLQNAKDARLHDADELARQIEQLERQVHGNLSIDTQRADHIAALEEQLRQAHVMRERRAREWRAEHMAALGAQVGKFEMIACAREVRVAWDAVGDTADGELELIRSNREMLAVLLRHLLSVST